MSQKTYLVAGAAGFIGAHMGKRILDEGHKLIAIDNLISGKESNLDSFRDHPHFQFIKRDICDPTVLQIDEPIDFVLNYACPASPIDYRKFPLETLRVCSLGVENLLKLALAKKARFFHTSTSEVYGDPLEHPQKESYWGHVNPYGERSCYDEGKRFAEALIYIYQKDLGLNAGIVRIFNTYGPLMKPFDGRVVSTFIRQALAQEPLTIFGDGSQTRSFCYISDQLEGQWRLIHSSEQAPINIGNPGEFTMLQLAEKVIQKTGSHSEIVYKPLPQDDPTQRQPDITLAKQKLDWEPIISLDEGIDQTIAWFKTISY